jgi:hypothetical protein
MCTELPMNLMLDTGPLHIPHHTHVPATATYIFAQVVLPVFADAWVPCPADMLALMQQAPWKRHSRTINNRSNYSTTLVAPMDGLGFHEPVDDGTCVIYMQGQVMHWAKHIMTNEVRFEHHQDAP